MKYIFVLILCALAISIDAQSAVGTWQTIDDETGQAKSHVEIYEQDGKFYGKVVKLLLKPEDTVCVKCKGDKKDQLVQGMVVLRDMKAKKDKWAGGKILDPENGKEYKCKMELVSANKLEVRGFIGFSLLGRTQTWHRVK